MIVLTQIPVSEDFQIIKFDNANVRIWSTPDITFYVNLHIGAVKHKIDIMCMKLTTQYLHGRRNEEKLVF